MSAQPKDRWDRALIIAQIVGAVGTPVVVALIAGLATLYVTGEAKQRELAAQEMMQALAVLQAPADTEAKKELHRWAFSVVQRRLGDVPPSEWIKLWSERKVWMERAEELCFRPSADFLVRSNSSLSSRADAGPEFTQTTTTSNKNCAARVM